MTTKIREGLLAAHKEVYNVPLHNGNVFGSIPLGHTTNFKVKYQKCIEMLVLEKDRKRRYRYHKHNWMFC